MQGSASVLLRIYPFRHSGEQTMIGRIGRKEYADGAESTDKIIPGKRFAQESCLPKKSFGA
jgi:hypothetical protein